MDKKGIYIHIPFCRSRCYYCDFYLITDLSVTQKYLNALKKEIENAGLVSFIKEKSVAGTVFNVVFIGKYETKKEAEDFLPLANARFGIAGRVVEIDK